MSEDSIVNEALVVGAELGVSPIKENNIVTLEGTQNGRPFKINILNISNNRANIKIKINLRHSLSHTIGLKLKNPITSILKKLGVISKISTGNAQFDEKLDFRKIQIIPHNKNITKIKSETEYTEFIQKILDEDLCQRILKWDWSSSTELEINPEELVFTDYKINFQRIQFMQLFRILFEMCERIELKS